jgi:hypothetical protein
VTDRIAVILAALIAASILADVTLNDSTASFFLLHKLADLIEFVSFWR